MEGKILSDKLSLYSKAAKLSLENAEQWIKDAKLIMKHGSFGHASALIRFAVEESVKAYVCWFTSERIWPIENKAIRDVFRYHGVKNELILGFLFGMMAQTRFHSWKRLKESMPKISQEKLLEVSEEYEKMLTSTKKMRERAMYVDVFPERKELETPLEIMKEEPKSILMMAELFTKIVRDMAEKMPEEEKARLRGIFSKIPKEDWETGELTIDWLPEAIKEIS